MLSCIAKSRTLVVKCDERAFVNLLNFLRRSQQYKIIIAKSLSLDSEDLNMKNNSNEKFCHVPQGEWKPDENTRKPVPKKYEVNTCVVGVGAESTVVVNCRIEKFKIRILFEQGIDLEKFLLEDAETGRIYTVENNICQPLIDPAELLKAMCAARPEERSLACRDNNPALDNCATGCPFWEAFDNGPIENIEESVDSATGRTRFTMILKVTFRERHERVLGRIPCPACGHMIREVYNDERKPD